MRLFTRRRLIALAIADVCIALLLWYVFLYEPPYAGLVSPVNRTGIFAHRGFGNYAPDNSLSGALLAMNANMEGVDVDGQLSSDGRLVIFHDLSVDRLTTGMGKVKDKTLQELLALDLATKYGNGFSGSYVATFDDFVRRLHTNGVVMVELKVTGMQPTGIEQQAVDIIRKYGAEERVLLSSFNPFVLYRLKQLAPNIRTVMIMMDTNWNPELLAEIQPEDLVSLPWFLRQEWIRRGIRKLIQPDLLSVNYKVDERTIDTLLAKGYPIFLWTPDSETDLRWSLEKQPYGVISDEPILAKELRDALPRP